MRIKTQLIEVYRTSDGKRATVSAHPDTGVWMVRVYNRNGTVNSGGNYATRKGAMIALAQKCGKSRVFVGMESKVID